MDRLSRGHTRHTAVTAARILIPRRLSETLRSAWMLAKELPEPHRRMPGPGGSPCYAELLGGYSALLVTLTFNDIPAP